MYPPVPHWYFDLRQSDRSFYQALKENIKENSQGSAEDAKQ
jgi:hypothetical protein